jgi:hypothetical protein
MVYRRRYPIRIWESFLGGMQGSVRGLLTEVTNPCGRGEYPQKEYDGECTTDRLRAAVDAG